MAAPEDTPRSFASAYERHLDEAKRLEDEITLTKPMRNIEEKPLSDINKKIELIQKVLTRCQIREPNFRSHRIEHRIRYYTGEPPFEILSALNARKNAKEFKDFIKDNENLKSKMLQNASDIFELLYNNYVTIKNVSDMIELTANKDHNRLKHLGFYWKRLANSNYCMLIEHPEQQAKRIQYLLNIQEYNAQNKTFIYVGRKKATNGKDIFILAASPEAGLIHASFLNQTFDDWLENNVYPHLNSSAVLVYEDDPNDYTIKPPNPEDTKNEMMVWLQRHDIHYHPTMRRAQLYKLIEIYTKKVKLCPRDEILRAKGINVLRTPEGWPKLDIFHVVWQLPGISGDSLNEESYLRILKTYFFENWRGQMTKYKNYRDLLYLQNMQVEEVIDKMATMATHTELYPGLPLTKVHEIGRLKLWNDCVILDRFKKDKTTSF